MDVTTNTVSEIADVSALCGGEIAGATLDYVPLTEHLIRNKFRLFNKTRQHLAADIHTVEQFRPTQMFIDSKQGINLMLMGYVFKPCSDTYSANLFEYDNTLDINLIIDETITTG